MMKLPIRLGQRVFGVTSKGVIAPTLISRIELPEEHESDFLESFSRSLKGTVHGNISGIQFRALNHHFDKVHLLFDGAYDKALAVLKNLKDNDSVSVRDQKEYQDRYDQLSTNKESERDRVDAVTHFSESETIISRQFKKKDGERYYTQKDFPQHYIEVGTPVWIVDTDEWQLIQGHVTEVYFSPHWPRKLIYCCGSHRNIRATHIFRTKKGAMNFLDKVFRKTLPGTLDRKRVPIVKQISQSEKREEAREFARRHTSRKRMLG